MWEPDLQREIDRFDQLLAGRGFSDERVKLLMTLPGVDVTTAESVLAPLGDIHRFREPEQAAAYLGLVPSTRQSAKKCYHGPIIQRRMTSAVRTRAQNSAKCNDPSRGQSACGTSGATTRPAGC